MEKTANSENGKRDIPAAMDLLLERISALEKQNALMKQENGALKTKVCELEDKVENMEVERTALREKIKQEQLENSRQQPSGYPMPPSLKSLQSSYIQSSKGRRRDSVIFDGFRASFGISHRATLGRLENRFKNAFFDDYCLSKFVVEGGQKPLSYLANGEHINEMKMEDGEEEGATEILEMSCRSAPVMVSWIGKPKVEKDAGGASGEEEEEEEEEEEASEWESEKGDENKAAAEIPKKSNSDSVLAEQKMLGVDSTSLEREEKSSDLNADNDGIYSAEFNDILVGDKECTLEQDSQSGIHPRQETVTTYSQAEEQQNHEADEQLQTLQSPEVMHRNSESRNESKSFKVKTNTVRENELPDGDHISQVENDNDSNIIPNIVDNMMPNKNQDIESIEMLLQSSLPKRDVSFALGDRKTNRYSNMMSNYHTASKVIHLWQSKPLQLLATSGASEKAKTSSFGAFKSFYLFSIDCSRYVDENHAKNNSVSFSESTASSQTPEQLESFLQGRRYLDPFTLPTSHCVDEYPQLTKMERKKTDSLDPEAISTFCCPDGIQVRLIPRSAMSTPADDKANEEGSSADVGSGSRGGAEGLGWIGSRGDRYNVLVFTDGDGSNTHGVAITVRSILCENDDDNRKFISLLRQQRVRRSAIRKIQQWWKQVRTFLSLKADKKQLKKGRSFDVNLRGLRSLFGSKNESNQPPPLSGQKKLQSARGGKRMRSLIVTRKAKSFGNDEDRRLARSAVTSRDDESILDSSFHSFGSLSSDSDDVIDDIQGREDASQFGKDLDTAEERRLSEMLNATSSVKQDMLHNSSGSLSSDSDNDIGYIKAQDKSEEETESSSIHSENDSVSGEFLDWNGVSHKQDDSFLKQERVNSLARESYQAMNDSAERGDACIVEKCYVLIGGAPSEQFLHLHLLHDMIMKEQMKEHEGAEHPPRRGKVQRQTIVGQLAGKWWNILKPREVDFETMLPSDGKSSILKFRHEFLDVLREKLHLTPEQKRIDLEHSINSLPSVSKPFEISVPSLSSETSKICISLPLPQVAGHWGVAAIAHRIHPMDLLLILKLLLIERSVLVVGESTHLVTACTCAILQLLKPFEWASTFMPLLPDSMLDFVCSPVPFLTGMVVKDAIGFSVENDERITEAMRCGLSVVNLTSGSVALTTEPQIAPLLRSCSTLSELTILSSKLESYQKSHHELRSFSRFLREGLSLDEMNSIDSFSDLICCFFKGLAENIATDTNGWQKYGEFDEDGVEFDFYPSLFVDRLKEKVRSLECRVQFQEMMVYSQLFVEFVDGRRKLALNRAEAGKYIANWVNLHRHLKRKRRRKSRSSSTNSIAHFFQKRS